MTRIALIIVGLATTLINGCVKSSDDLLGQAHRAALQQLGYPRSAQFDDSFTQVFPEKGLVCGSKVEIPSGFGESAGYQPYYFSRSLGISFEARSQAWIPLANACIAGIVERVTATNHRLEGEEAGI